MNYEEKANVENNDESVHKCDTGGIRTHVIQFSGKPTKRQDTPQAEYSECHRNSSSLSDMAKFLHDPKNTMRNTRPEYLYKTFLNKN